MRLGRIFALQSAVADEASRRTLYWMVDEHVEFELRNTYFEQEAVQIAHCLLLTAHCILLTTHYSLRTTY